MYLLNQKNMLGCQAWWLEKISSFVFEVVYIAGSENMLADALSWMYAHDSVGTMRAVSEFVCHDVPVDDVQVRKMPLLVGMEPVVASQQSCDWSLPAETGRPETLKEFTARMKDKFILRGPRACLEGRSGSTHTQRKPTTPEDLTESSNNRTAHHQGTFSSLTDQGTLGQKESNNRISNQMEADQEADQMEAGTSEVMLLDATENNNMDLLKSI